MRLMTLARFHAATRWKPPEPIRFTVSFAPEAGTLLVVMRACCCVHTTVIPDDMPVRGVRVGLDLIAADLLGRYRATHRGGDHEPAGLGSAAAAFEAAVARANGE